MAPPPAMRVLSSVVTQVFRVPYEERKLDSEFGEGESWRTCKNIMKDTGAHIEISSGKDKSLTFLVTGRNNEVTEARRKILSHFQTQASKQILIPKEHHRWVLGKKGEHLRELERETATKINVPNISEESDVITISGTKEGIEKAEHTIRTLSDEQSKKSKASVIVPKIYHPFILGPANETLNQMIEQTGVRINVPPQSVNKDEIIIIGEKEGVMAAKAKIEAIHQDMEKKCTTVSVEVPKLQHKHVIGNRGATIQEILRTTGVSVEMPPNDTTDTITLRGPSQTLGVALSMVYDKANSVRTVVIEAPAWIHKFIIGRKGVNIKELSTEYQSNIEFLDNKIKIEAHPEWVEKAKEHLESLINNYVTNLTYVELLVNPIHHKHIIGKSGANVNRLKEDLEVTISFEVRDGNNYVRIEGPIDGVQRAQIELQDQINKLDNEKEKTLNVDRTVLRAVRNIRGESIRDIKERFAQVTILFPALNDDSEIVRLRGPKDEVDKAAKYLVKFFEEVKESSFVMEVPIHKQFHKFIIGRGGVNIKKIRDETQTRIDLPAEGDNNDNIVITGKKANVLDARDRIEKIKNELADIVNEEITINPKFYNALIGTKGKLIANIMEECGGVLIKFPTPDSKSDKVTLRGQKEDVEKAKAQLLDLSSQRELSSYSEEVRAKNQHHRFLIGKNGVSIKKIRDSTGARIIFPSSNDEDKDIITIIGKKEGVIQAKAQLEAIIKEIDNVTEREINVEQRFHKNFVARRGELLHRISDDCGGVTISFPRQGTDSTRVTLKGAKEFIDAAVLRINEIVIDLENQVTIEVVIPQRHHRMVMGQKGSKVQRITSDFNVVVKFPDRDAVEPVDTELTNGDANGDVVRQTDIIRITGNNKKCELAKEALLKLVPVTEEINVAFDLHRSIIGQKGRDVRDLMNNYDVHIELSPQHERLDIIKVTGAADNVEEAKKAIFERVAKLEEDRKVRELRSFELKIEVEPEFHPKIIGRRGAVINKIRADHNVQISFPKKEDADEQQHVITIQGYEKDAHAAKDDIMKIVNELTDLYKEVVSIDDRIHSRIIGQRGRNVHKIMEDYKVDIKFPRSGDPDPCAVTITGQEDNVLEAKDHLLNLEEEFLQDVTDTVPTTTNAFSDVLEEAFSQRKPQQKPHGFVVQGAPWEKSAPNTESQIDFPDFGVSAPVATDQSISSAWGPRR